MFIRALNIKKASEKKKFLTLLNAGKETGIKSISNSEICIKTPILYGLIAAQNAPLVKKILDEGADPNAAAGSHEIKPIYKALAETAGCPEIVKLLCEAKADFRKIIYDSLEYALLPGYEAFLKALIQKIPGIPNIMMKTSPIPMLPIQFACQKNNVKAMKILLAHGADLNCTYKKPKMKCRTTNKLFKNISNSLLSQYHILLLYLAGLKTAYA